MLLKYEIGYDKVSRKLTNGVPNAKKLITRPIMTVTSPNSPHIALTYTKLRFDRFFDHTYPPSWSRSYKSSPTAPMGGGPKEFGGTKAFKPLVQRGVIVSFGPPKIIVLSLKFHHLSSPQNNCSVPSNSVSSRPQNHSDPSNSVFGPHFGIWRNRSSVHYHVQTAIYLT